MLLSRLWGLVSRRVECLQVQFEGILSVIDSITMPAPDARVNFGGATNQRPGRKEPNNDHYRMRLPPGLPTNCVCGYRNGRLREQRLEHREGAEKFYRELAAQGKKVRVGMEASGHARWFERLLGETEFRVVDGRCGEIRSQASAASRRRIGQDAQHILHLLLKVIFPRSGYRVGRIGICGNCCGTGTGWCRRARDHEPVASGSAERRATVQEEAVAGARTRTTGVVSLSPWASRRRRICWSCWIG